MPSPIHYVPVEGVSRVALDRTYTLPNISQSPMQRLLMLYAIF